MPTHIGSININVDTSQVRNASAAIQALGNQATATQRLLNSLSTINLNPAAIAANNLAQQITNVATAATTAQQQLTQMGNAGGGIGNGFSSADTSISGMIQSLTGLGGGAQLIVGLGSAAIGLGKSLFDSYQPVQSLRMGLQALGQDGNASLMSIVQTANSIGVSFTSVSKGLLQFNAATQGTSLEGAKANEIFATMAGSVKMFGGATENVDGAMKALTQMLGKGVVSSDELKQQLGEHVPGAFRLAAESMGMSQAELSKALKAGAIDAEGFLIRLSDLMKEKYGKGIEAAAHTTKSELEKAGNDWALFTANMGSNVDIAIGKVMQLINKMGTLKDMNLPGVIEGAHASLKRGAGNNGLTPDQQAQVMIDAYNATRKSRPELPEIKSTKKEILDSGITNTRKLTPAEQWAEHTGSIYRSGDKGGQVAVNHIGNYYQDLKETGKQQEDAKKSAEFKKKDHAEQLTWAEQYRKATLSQNKSELARLEILREQRNLQVQLKGAGDNQERKDDITAASLQKQAEIKVKYEDKKKGGLSAAQKQDLRADGYDSQIEHMFDKWAIGATKIQEGAVAAAMQEIELARQRKQEEIDTALKFKKITKERHDAEIGNLNKEAELAKTLATIRIEAEEAAKAAKTERENQLKIEQNVLRIYQKQNEEITKAAKESAKMRADLEKLVKNTNRSIGRDLINSNPMADKTSLQREDYVNKATDPFANQLDGLKSKLEELYASTGTEDGISAAQMKQLEDLQTQIENVTQAMDRMGQVAGAAFDKMQADSKNLTLAMTGAAHSYLQNIDAAKMASNIASNTVTEFGSTLSEALGSKEGWKNREQGIKNYFASMLKQMSNMVIQLGVVKPLMESIFGGASGSPSSGASGWLGMIAKIGMSLGGGPVEGDKDFMGPVMPKANGGAFNKGVEFFANGGVFDSPTMFKHAGGLGVMGEAGPESIMPLKRGKDGKLGVVASGGGGSQINNFTPTIVIQGNADDESIAKMQAALRAEFKQHVSQSINKNNVKSQRPGGMIYAR